MCAFMDSACLQTLVAQGKHDEALILFVKTCAASLSFLDLLEEAVPTLEAVLKHAEDKLKKLDRALPLLQ
jgi:hypothetical protein